MKRNAIVMAVVAAALLVMLWAALRHARSGGSAMLPGGLRAKVEGAAAPDFELADIKTGKNVRLSDFRGKAVLLNFWATWCAPCKVEIPWFVDLQNQYGAKGLAVIGVAMDDVGRDSILKFANDMSVNYPVLQGTEKVGAAYGGVEGLPTTFYIGRDGRITKRVAGLISHGEIEENIKAALRQGEQHVAAKADDIGIH